MVVLAAAVEHWTRLYADREKSRNAFLAKPYTLFKSLQDRNIAGK